MVSALPRESNLFLHDIIEAAERIEEIVADMSFPKFEKDQRTQAAVLWNLTVIGEAVSQLSRDVVERHADVPWRRIRGLRNIVVHRYFVVDVPEVWRVATQEMAPLRAQIRRVLREEAQRERSSHALARAMRSSCESGHTR